MMSATCLSTPRSLTGGTSLRPISLLLRPSGIRLATSSWRAVSPPPRASGTATGCVVVGSLSRLGHQLQFVPIRIVAINDGEHVNAWDFACRGTELRQRLEIIGIGGATASRADDQDRVDSGRILSGFQLSDGQRNRAVESGLIRRLTEASDSGLELSPMRTQRLQRDKLGKRLRTACGRGDFPCPDQVVISQLA